MKHARGLIRWAPIVALLMAGPAAAQITRAGNTTLQMPSNPGGPVTYGVQPAFAGLTFTAPIAITSPPGDTKRLFVVERAGRIKVIPDLNSPSTSTFLDISSRVATSGEEGLLGLAFHPNYANNGFFYVFYSTPTPCPTDSTKTCAFERVSRFSVSTTNANSANASSEQMLIEQVDEASNHNGGDLHFGADGYLYISLGDEGQQNGTLNNTQRIDKDFFSGILRIDVDKKPGNLTPNAHAAVKTGTYLVPADNPFVGATSFNGSSVSPSNVRTEFWAVGLRNPWRFSFDPSTGQLWCGDVGQDTHEEIDIIQKGKNYGWNFREGLFARPNSPAPPAAAVFTDPIWDYDHTQGASVTGGVVYRGTAMPELAGAYIYGDYISGSIWKLTPTGAGGAWQATKLTTQASVNAFGVDPRNGDVLISSLNNAVLRLVRTSGGGTIPAKLSQTGAFSDLVTLTPNQGIVAYAPNVPFWSDNAIKTRWFSIPNIADKMTFANDSNWSFPTGQVWIKHFDMVMDRRNPSVKRRLETRFLVKTATAVYGVTYKWNATGTDADLVQDTGLNEPLDIIDENGNPAPQTWRYPSTTECTTCHTQVGGYALSFTTRQLNGNFPYPSGSANQITALTNANYFSGTVPNPSTLNKVYLASDTTQSVETRARSYLQVNCSQCHQPGGPGQGTWDARMSTALASAGIINGPLNDYRGDTANRVLASQDPGHSMILRRMQNLTNAPRMPPIGSNVLDQTSIQLVTDWVASLPLTFEAESTALSPSVTTGTSAATVVTDANTSGGAWSQYIPPGANNWVEYHNVSLPAGTFTVKMKYKANTGRAQVTLKVDGTQVGGTLDEFASAVAYLEATFGTVTFSSAGAHSLRLTATGRNGSSTGWNVSADLFTFVPSGPPPPPPPAPQSLSATGGVNQVQLNWTVQPSSNHTGFKIERLNSSGSFAFLASAPASALSYTDSGLTAGSYTYQVKATNASGDSSPSNQATASATNPPPPPKPTSLTATGGTNQVKLDWTVSGTSNHTGFRIEKVINGSFAFLTNVGASVRTFTDGGLAAGSYTYQVIATNTGGDSPPSDPATATASSGPPVPSITNLVVNDTSTANPPSGDGVANSTQWSVQSNFQSGLVPFGDRSAFQITSVGGSEVQGGPWIRTAADSKLYGTQVPAPTLPLATFTATGSFVYLIIDDRWKGTGTRPTWLDPNFVDTGNKVMVKESSTKTSTYTIWRLPIVSGSSITLPTAGASTAPIYMVVVK